MSKVHQDRIQSLAFVISACIAICFSWSFMTSLRADESSPVVNTSQLRNRINPNVASVESLTRLPGMGVGRAGAIVAFRENFRKKNGRSLAFEDCNDLLKISGLGPKTVQGISDWLEFE